MIWWGVVARRRVDAYRLVCQWCANSCVDPMPDLSEKRRAVSDALRRIDPQLGDLFDHAVSLLPSLGGDPVAGYVVGHFGREVFNTVSRRVVGSPSGGRAQEVGEGPSNRVQVARLLQEDPASPTVARWLGAHDAFMALAHVRDSAPSDAKLQKLAEAFDDATALLYGLLGLYFETEAELDQLLGLGTPSTEDADRLTTLLLRRAQRRYFFGRLKDFAWFDLLEAQGLLNPPLTNPVPDPDGREEPWWAVDYLRHVATSHPEPVLDFLDRLPDDYTSPTVAAGVIACVGSMKDGPSPRGASLTTSALRRSPGPHAVQAALEIGVAALHDDSAAGFEIIGQILRVPSDASPQRGQVGSHMLPRARFLDFDDLLDRVIPAMVEVDALEAFHFFDRRLGHARRFFARGDEFFVTDLERVRLHGPPERFLEPPELLARATDVAARSAAALDRDSCLKVLATLEADERRLSKRLYFRALTAGGKHVPEVVERVLRSAQVVSPGFGAREVAEFLRTWFVRGSDAAKAVFVHGVRSLPDHEALSAVLEMRGIEHPTKTDIEEVIHGYWQDRVRWFRGDIPAELRALATECGELGHTPTDMESALAEDGYAVGATYTGGVPEDTYVNRLEGLEVSDLASEVLSMLAAEDGRQRGEVERRVAADLASIARGRPAIVPDAILAFSVASVPRLCSAGLVEGLLQADPLSDGQLIDTVGAILPVLRDSIADGSIPRSLVEPVARLARRASFAARTEGGEAVWELVMLVSRAVVEPGLPEEDEPQLFILLNQYPANLVDAAVILTLPEGTTTSDGSGATEQLDSAIAALVAQSDASRMSVEAGIGRRLGYLRSLPGWLESRVEGVVEPGLGGDLRFPAWTAYLRTPVHLDAAEEFAPWYRATLDSLNGANEREETEALATHILLAASHEALDPASALVRRTLETVDRDILRRAFWHVGSGLAEEGPQREPDRRRKQAFLRALLPHLRACRDPTRAGCLGPLIWSGAPATTSDEVELMAEVVEVAEGQIEMITGWATVRDWVDLNPAASMRVVAKTVRHALRPGGFVSETHLEPVVEALVETSGSSGLSEALRVLINELGAGGYRSFKRFLGDL